MGDHNLVQALHAAISQRDWWAVEQAANRIRDDRRIQWPPRDEPIRRQVSPPGWLDEADRPPAYDVPMSPLLQQFADRAKAFFTR